MRFEVEDCTQMTYADESFEVAIDKSTLDAIMCGADGPLNAAKLLGEAQRVLVDGGYYIVISYGSPENRLHCFQHECYNWASVE